MDIQELESDAAILEAFPLMKALRERIARDTFLEEVRRQQEHGYRLLGGFENGALVALAGIRRAHTLSRGEHVFVDDLVSGASVRGAGHGRTMMRWIARHAAAESIPRIYSRRPHHGEGVLREARLHLPHVDSLLCRRGAAGMNVRITRVRSHAALPRYESAGAAAFDLASAEDVTIQPGEVALVPTGLVVEVPAGMFLGIFARSSTPLKRGLMVANGVGVIDPDYSGPSDEVKVAVLNFRATAVTLARGERIAQGIFLPAPRVTWIEVDDLESPSRGGFGATG